MANFLEAFNKTMKYEGGYSNHPSDFGKETYRGISRKYHPDWKGWITIDSYKNHNDFPKVLDSNLELQESIKQLYKDKYWNVFLGDLIIVQHLAEELFDISVNMSTERAGKFLQRGLNLLNRNQVLYPDLVVDGKIGAKTMNALTQYLSKASYEHLLKTIVILRGMHYIEFATQSPEQEEFFKGWMNRVDFIYN